MIYKNALFSDGAAKSMANIISQIKFIKSESQLFTFAIIKINKYITQLHLLSGTGLHLVANIFSSHF